MPTVESGIRMNPSEHAAPPTIWSADTPLPDYATLRPLPGVSHHLIHAGDAAQPFLLGVSIAAHRGIFHAAWGASAKDENDTQSAFVAKTSRDARTWSDLQPITPKPAGPDAHSHGVLLSTGDALWAFAPRARFGDIEEYPGLRMEVFRFDETRAAWESRGETAPGFWPLGEPQRMDDGNWILAGAVPHRWPRCDPAVALSHGDDLTRWSVVTIPTAQTTWGETAVLVDGPQIRAFIRPPADGLPLLTADSADFGRTWTTAQAGNLPVSASKPYAGRLRNGIGYLIVNLPVAGLEARDTLALALQRPGDAGFTELHLLRQGPSPAPRTAGAGIARQWAYPYAIEHDGKLLVVYASTKENAELSIVELGVLEGLRE